MSETRRCPECGGDMKQVKLTTGFGGVYLSMPGKGLMAEKRSSISSYVCVDCGKIDLRADDPKTFADRYAAE